MAPLVIGIGLGIVALNERSRRKHAQHQVRMIEQYSRIQHRRSYDEGREAGYLERSIDEIQLIVNDTH